MINSKAEITFRMNDPGMFEYAAVFVDLQNYSLVIHRFNQDQVNTGHFEIFDLREHPELTEVWDMARGAWDMEALNCLLIQPHDLTAAAD